MGFHCVEQYLKRLLKNLKAKREWEFMRVNESWLSLVLDSHRFVSRYTLMRRDDTFRCVWSIKLFFSFERYMTVEETFLMQTLACHFSSIVITRIWLPQICTKYFSVSKSGTAFVQLSCRTVFAEERRGFSIIKMFRQLHPVNNFFNIIYWTTPCNV